MLKEVLMEDVLSIVLQTSNEIDTMINVEYTTINHIRNSLRKSGAILDMGEREIETVRRRYPSNIFIETTDIKIVKQTDFVRCMQGRAAKIAQKDINEIQKLLMEMEL